jgi:protein SPT2
VSSVFKITHAMIQISDLLAQITGEPSPTTPNATFNFPPKRKADDQLRKPVDKMQKTGSTPANSSKPVSQSSRPSAVDGPMAKMKLVPSAPQRPLPSTSSTTFKNGQPTPPPTSDALKVPPKKGSYAEIMARAKAAQAVSGQVGKIQHKKIEKQPSKREREEMKTQKGAKLQKSLGPNSKFQKGGHAPGQPPLRDARNDGRNGARETNGKASADPVVEKKVKKSALATTGYAGTARPKPGSAKVHSKSSASASASRHDRGPDRYRDDRYGSSSKRYASEEEDEEEDQEYDSDVSSDMEAAAFEVDEEEELAARIARREDAEAMAEENRLKREKEEKRRRLAAMAKSRR